MSITQYWVGQVPNLPLVLNILDSGGVPLDCSGYDSFNIIMLDRNNIAVDLTGSTVQASQINQGRFLFRWPAKSVFAEAGNYIIQLSLNKLDGSAKDFTSTHTFVVKELGGNKDNVRIFGSSIFDYGV